MTSAVPARPRKILLATDLSCRCDRALDRAVLLAAQWGAELIAAYVVDPAEQRPYRFGRTVPAWHRQPSAVERMRWRLHRDLAGGADNIRIIVEEGDPAEQLLAIAAREECDLIVSGIARDETLGRIFIGNTVNRLVRGSPVPVLIVRNRARAPYRTAVVATDFSEASMQALLATDTLLPGAYLTLFHGYDIPFAGYLDDADYRKILGNMEKDLGTKFMSDPRVSDALRGRTSIIIDHGSIARLLGEYVEDQNVDLTVIGSHGRSALFDTFIGSTAKTLVENLNGDLLIVRYRPAGN
jgi:nucleotide-binding universal stress UspA family protein